MSLYDVSVLGFGDNVVDKYVDKKTMYPGGNCVNFAVYANLFGAKRSAYMGYFGKDEAAELVIGALKALHIETVKCKQLDGENGWSENTLKDGDRVFLDYNHGGVRGKTPFVLDRFDLEYIKTFDLVHSGNYCFTENELRKIHETGVPLSFDFSDDSTQEYYQNVAPNVDYAFMSCSEMNDEELCIHLKTVSDLGPSIVVATRGSKGATAFDGENFYTQEASPVDKVIDTMGAGDSLITSFLVGYIARIKTGKEKSRAITEALAEASKFAAKKISRYNGAFGFGQKY